MAPAAIPMFNTALAGEGRRVRLPARLIETRKRPMRIRRIALCLGLGVTPGLAPAAHAQYHVTVLQDVGGLGINEPFAINDAGQSVGWSHSAGGVEAVLWSASGKAAVLQDVGSQGISIVKAINDAGQSVGYSVTTSGMDAVLWSPSGKATVLQDVGGQGNSSAGAINNAGWSVGFSCTTSPWLGRDAVLWSPSGKAKVLQDMGGRGFSAPNAINDAGWSVGESCTTSNCSGEDAVLWSPSRKAIVLQDAGARGNSYVTAINDSRWSVGWSETPGVCPPKFCNGPLEEAVLWSPSGKATDLGAVLGPAWSWTEAVGINNSGDIIGYGIYHGGQYGFLLTSVPEPSTWAMLLAGFAGLGFAGYRRAKTGHATLAA